MKSAINPLIAEVFESLKVPLEDGVLNRLEFYVQEIIRWNRKINLTGARNALDFIRGPLFDALTLLPVFVPGRTLIDVGTGGGLPGIPLAIICGDCRVTLVEPRSKRVAFLSHVCHGLDLTSEILSVRSEDLGERRWQGAVAQAVWSPAEWIPRGAELVVPGGEIYVLSSQPVDSAVIVQGFEVASEVEISRPFDGAKRYSMRIVDRDR